MDSTTPNPSLTLQPQPHNPNLSIKSFASKLPIKRKTPHSSSSSSNPNPTRSPKLQPHDDDDDDDDDDEDDIDIAQKQPPFKFHRIWTEPDEIRFLQGLLASFSDGLFFPRDLNLFYSRFSGTMSQPYTKSQLSEKLRRLRKKFRVISSRLARGLDENLLSPHDRALFSLSKKLWHPDFASHSPFGSGNKLKKSNLVGVEVSFSPILPPDLVHISNQPPLIRELNNNNNNNCCDYEEGCVGVGEFDVKLSEVNVELDGKQEMPSVAANIVIDVFDQCLNEVRVALEGSAKARKADDFEGRWREQRVAELDVLARRLRLVLEDSLQRKYE